MHSSMAAHFIWETQFVSLLVPNRKQLKAACSATKGFEQQSLAGHVMYSIYPAADAGIVERLEPQRQEEC